MIRIDPLRGFRFLVEMNGLLIGAFARVKGLARELKVESQREGGVNHYEHDYLELDGPAPTFQVWTGPRWKLDGAGSARPVSGTALCNSEYNVEVSIDPTFATAVSSGWTSVDTDTGNSDPDCFGTFTPAAAEWTALQSDGALSRIYYRVSTRSGAGVNERISTEPGNGLWTVPPAYAVITTNGESDY